MNVNKLTWTGLLLAMCVIGANFKILGSIALDSFPAFLGAIILGPVYGAFLGVFGHVISALLSGFPLTIPIHGVISLFMGGCMFTFGWIRARTSRETVSNKVLSWGAGYLLNVCATLLVLYPFLNDIVFGLFLPLSVATLANLAITEMVYLALPDRIKEFKRKTV